MLAPHMSHLEKLSLPNILLLSYLGTFSHHATSLKPTSRKSFTIVQGEMILKPCSNLASIALKSMSPLNDTMLNFDIDVGVDAQSNAWCEQGLVF